MQVGPYYKYDIIISVNTDGIYGVSLWYNVQTISGFQEQQLLIEY